MTKGGIDVVQMFVGLRLGASEVVGNDENDLTVYPILSFGVEVKPTSPVTLYAEGSVALGITTQDTGDTALSVYPSAGMRIAFDEVWEEGDAD